MNRALVLTTESARHPFRVRFTPSATVPEPRAEPMTDVAFFLVSFVSGFVIIFGMIL